MLSAGCQKEAKPQPARVFYAASLANVVHELVGSDRADSFSFQSGGSRTLVAQVNAGAKVDLLLLADDELGSKLLNAEGAQRAVLATNQLVLVAPATREVTPDLSTDRSSLAIADSQTAPLGRYTDQALEKEPLAAKKVRLKDAAAVVAAVSLQHVDAGIVYATDATAKNGLRELKKIEDSLHEPIRYEAILLRPNQPAAAELFRRLTSPEGEAAFRKWGFGSP